MSRNIFRTAFVLIFSLLMAGAVFAAPPVKIGALFSVSGPASFLGEPERNTAVMMVDEINKAGGIKGRKLELIVYDTQGDATKAVQAANKLIKDDKVVAIPARPATAWPSFPLWKKRRFLLSPARRELK